MKKTFEKDYIMDHLGLPYSPHEDRVTVVLDEVEDDSGRWSVLRRLVFRLADQPEDEAWETFYSVGKTELQDETPWELDDSVECYPVKRTTKTIVVWR